MKDIIKRWDFWAILLVVLIASIGFFASKLSSVSITELNCECSENIKCSSSFICNIPVGEVCGHCSKIGGGGATSDGGGPSQT